MDKKRVLMLLMNPFTHDSRVLKEGQTLIANGYDVSIKCYLRPGLPINEVVDGIQVERLVEVGDVDSVHRPMTLLKFALKCIFSSNRYGIIHCNDLLTLPIGVVIKWLHFNRPKVIYDSHEYQTERIHTPDWARGILKFGEWFFIRFADEMMTVSDSIAEEYAKNYKMKKPDVVLNCPRYRDAAPKNLFREKLGIAEDDMIFLYQGGFMRGRGIDIMIECFSRLQDPKKHLVFMGYGWLIEQVKDAAKTHANIHYVEAVKPWELLDSTSSADVGLLFLENICLNHYYCSPNKLFEYLMADLPVIASPLFEISRILKRYQCGVVCDEITVEALLAAVEQMSFAEIEKLKPNVKAIKKQFSWEEQEKTFLRLY